MTDEESLVGGYGGRMLASLAVAWCVLQLGRFLLPPLLPAITDDLLISDFLAGVALGLHTAVYAAVQYPSGRLSDRFTRAALVVPGLVVLTLAFALFAGTTSVLVFFAGAVALGVGKGLYAVPSRAQLSDLFVARRGQALGLYAAGTDVGGILASVLALVVTGGAAATLGAFAGVVPTASALSWRSPYVPLVVVLAGVTGVYVHWNRERYRLGWTALGLRTTLARLATTAAQREVLVAFALFYFVAGGWVNFLPLYLESGKGFTASLAAALYAVMFLVGVVAKPLAGLTSDRLPRRLVGIGGLVLAVGALTAVVSAESPLAVGAAIAVFAVGYKAQFPVADALLLDAAPDENVGGDLGAARALFLGANAVGPVYVGWLATVASYRLAFVGLGVPLLVAAGLLARGARRTRG